MLDVKTNRVTKMFGKGCAENVLDVSGPVASAGQYSPTASYFFRTKDFQSMPNWFFEARDLPFGDYFLETILGRNGLAYLPNFYSVYRRNIPGSFTARTQNSSPDKLIRRIKSVLYYTNKLNDFDDIPKAAIKTRRQNIYIDSLNMALTRKSLKMYRNVLKLAKLNRESLPYHRTTAGHNIVLFALFRYYRWFYARSIVALKRMIEKVR
jgi:hypothetical protein